MVIDRLRNRVVFLIERFLLRGAFYQLLFIAGLIALVSVISGTIVWLALPDEFKGYGEAVWWGLLRLSDPGYLGDDEGALRRTVSLIVTVLGYVLFMGALIAIMTTALGRLMRRLEAGLTPIVMSGHVLILGWTDRTPTIIRELLLSEGRVRRFLDRIHKARLRIVVLAEQVEPARVQDLRSFLGPLWDARKLIFSTGSPLRVDHLARVDFLNAAAIIVAAADYDEAGPEALDAETIKTLLSVSDAAQRAGGRRPPDLTCEIFDSSKAPIAEAGYGGAVEIIPSSAVVSRLVAQNVRHGGLSYVYAELLTHGSGNQIYIREIPSLNGEAFHALPAAFPRAIPLGLMRPAGGDLVSMLNPPAGTRIEAGDRLVFMAETYEETLPTAAPRAIVVGAPGTGATAWGDGTKRVLVLGWSHKVPALLSEFASYDNESFAIDLVSLTPADERQRLIDRFAGPLDGLEITHIEADHTAPNDLTRVLVKPYDNIVLLASDRMATGSESDARTILGYLLLRRLLTDAGHRPGIVVELMDPENDELFHARTGEVLISPEIVSHMLAHVTLRPDLAILFEELFTSGGAEIFFRLPAQYELLGRTASFAAIQEAVAAHGDIALGILVGEQSGRRGAARLALNPARDTEWRLAEGDELVVLTTYA